MPYILEEKPGLKGEISIIDSINRLVPEGKVCGKLIDGVWHDTGNQLKYIYAVIDMALHDDRYKTDLLQYLNDKLYELKD